MSAFLPLNLRTGMVDELCYMHISNGISLWWLYLHKVAFTTSK